MSLAARDHPRRITADEFFATTDGLPFSQLIDGELVDAMTSPTIRHDRLVTELLVSHRLHARAHPDVGHMSINAAVVVGDHDVFVPDLWWVADPAALDPRSNRLPAAPPLVIEVRSPTTWRDDRGRKLQGYERVGVAELWLVDGEDEVVTVHRRSEASATFDVVRELRPGDVLTTPLIPGWVVDLTALFAFPT